MTAQDYVELAKDEPPYPMALAKEIWRRCVDVPDEEFAKDPLGVLYRIQKEVEGKANG